MANKADELKPDYAAQLAELTRERERDERVCGLGVPSVDADGQEYSGIVTVSPGTNLNLAHGKNVIVAVHGEGDPNRKPTTGACDASMRLSDGCREDFARWVLSR